MSPIAVPEVPSFRWFATAFREGAPWCDLCDRLDAAWRALPPSAASPEAAAARWLCHRLHIRAAGHAGSPASWALALRSGLWSTADALASAARLAPEAREQALTQCASFLPEASLGLVLEALTSGGAPRDRALLALGGRLVAAGDAERAREALRRIETPQWRVDLLKELAPKLDAGALIDEVDAAWDVVSAADHPSRRYLVQPLTELLEMAPARPERAAFIERCVLSLPEDEWQSNEDTPDQRVLAARAWSSAGDRERALAWARRIPDDDLPERVSVLPALAEPDRLLLAERALSTWTEDHHPGLLADIASACPALADRCVEAASSRCPDANERTAALLRLGPHVDAARLAPAVEETLSIAETIDRRSAYGRQNTLWEVLPAVAGREEPEIGALRERLFAAYLAAPALWTVPIFAKHLRGAHHEALWRWVVARSGAVNGADVERLGTAARALFEAGNEAFRDRVRDDARTLARRILHRIPDAPFLAASLLAWLPAEEHREVARLAVQADRDPVGIARELLEGVVTLLRQEGETPPVRDALRTLLVASKEVSLLPLADATPWGRAALMARTGVSTEADLWHHALRFRPLDDAEQKLLADVRDAEGFARWLDGEGEPYLHDAVDALSVADAAAVRALRPHLFEQAPPPELSPIDGTAALARLRSLLASKSRVAELVRCVAEAADGRELEELESILARRERTLFCHEPAVWAHLAWRYQALGDLARARAAAARVNFSQFRTALLLQLALASGDGEALLKTLPEASCGPYSPVLTLDDAGAQAAGEALLGPAHRLSHDLPRSSRVVVRSLVLAAGDDALARAGLTRAGIEAELREDLGPILAGAEPPRDDCLSYAAMALPITDIPVLWDGAWSAEAKLEMDGIGFPASAARIAYRWRGAEGLAALVKVAVEIG